MSTLCGNQFTTRKGFSILELLVVVAIAGVLMGITAPRLSSLMQHYRLDGDARKLMADIQRARFRAIAERKCFQVKFDTPVTTGSYQLKTDTAIGACAGGAFTASDGGEVQIDSSVKLTVVASANPVFDTRGSVSTPATIRLTNDRGAVRTVRVEATGRVRII